MKVFWTAQAAKDREVIFDYIEARNPQAALQLDEQISLKVRRLEDHPDSGRAGRVASTRELIAHRHYVVVYDTVSESIRILRVLHTARQWP